MVCSEHPRRRWVEPRSFPHRSPLVSLLEGFFPVFRLASGLMGFLFLLLLRWVVLVEALPTHEGQSGVPLLPSGPPPHRLFPLAREDCGGAKLLACRCFLRFFDPRRTVREGVSLVPPKKAVVWLQRGPCGRPIPVPR